MSMAVILTIFAFGSINLLRVITNADLDQAVNTFIADAKSQQNSAMLGDSQGEQYHGIKIDPDGYIFFKGDTFLESDPGNYKFNSPQNVILTTGFAQGIVVFSTMSGEIKDYLDTASNVTFTGPDGRSVTIRFNKLGNVSYYNKN